jgi:hypothetical protein
MQATPRRLAKSELYASRTQTTRHYSGWQRHRARPENLEVIYAPARGELVGPCVLSVRRIDSLARERTHMRLLARGGRCRRLPEQVDLIPGIGEEALQQGSVGFPGWRERLQLTSELSAPRAASASQMAIFSSVATGPNGACRRLELASVQIALARRTYSRMAGLLPSSSVGVEATIPAVAEVRRDLLLPLERSASNPATTSRAASAIPITQVMRERRRIAQFYASRAHATGASQGRSSPRRLRSPASA